MPVPARSHQAQADVRLPHRAHVALVLLLVVVAAASAGAVQAQDADAADRRPVLFAGDATYRPFHFLDERGRATGFDVELFRAIAATEDWQVGFRLGDWGENLERLARGEVDVVPMFVSEARALRYAFSEPFLSRNHLVFGRLGSEYVESIGSLSGRRVAVQHAGLAWEALRAIQPRVAIIPVAVEADAVMAIARGEADYAVVPSTIGYDVILNQQLQRVVALSPPVLPLQYAFAVNPARTELLAQINDGLRRVRANGEQDRLYLSWLANLGPARDGFRSGLMVGLWVALPLLLGALVLWAWLRRARDTAARQGRRADDESRRRVDAEARASYLAFNDTATGLPNRNSLERVLPGLLRIAGDGPAQLALVRLDLLGLNMIRTVAGEAMTSTVGCVMAERLVAVAGDDRVFSVGRGKFAVVLPGVADGAEAGRRMASLVQLLQERVEVQSLTLEQRCRAGMALFPGHARKADGLLRAAELACSAAHESAAACAVYDPSMEPDPGNLSLLVDLRDAIADDSLGYALQPKLDLASGRVSGAELLVRWRHPVRGPLPPAAFVPLAERTGVIGEMTQYLVGRAAGHLRDWRQRGLALSLSVNVSVNDLADTGLVDAIVADAQDLDGRLMLEITETDVMRDAASVLAAVSRLRSHGVKISLDDFGTGHSSFVYLRRLAPDEIKIDRSFIADVLASGSDQAIVRTCIALAHELGATVTAEGIEDMALIEWLVGAGCDTGQGYAIGRPMPVDRFEQLVRDNRADLRAAG
jgi:EAL domain-containing protein (putative c-di-GMP-specific phosphodiesterase class I)/ABC-type amino acid transport substrate-binding protein/GGDEF domain-containing protein